MKVYNGDGILLGRLCSRVAKDALLGEEVRVVNCNKVIVSGSKKDVFAHYRQKQDRKGYPLKSTKLPRLSDRFVRKAVRGMLPWKITRGKEAYVRIMCHIGVPEEFKDSEKIVVEAGKVSKLPNSKFVKVEEIVKYLGGTQ